MKTSIAGLIMSIVLVVFVSVPAFCEPVAIWGFDEGQGDKIADSSGNGNDGTITGNIGGVWVKGKFGGALYLDGGKNGADHVIVGHSESLNISDSITITAWFRPEVLGGDGLMGYRFIIKKEAVYALDIIGYKVCLYLANPSETWTTPASGKTDLKENQWYHLAGTYDGKVMRVYVDGQVDGEIDWGQKIGTTDRVVIMGMNVQNNNPLRNIASLVGILDEVAIYNNALSQADIKNVMNNGLLSVDSRDKLANTWAAMKIGNLTTD